MPPLQFNPVTYNDLNARQKEIYNFHNVAFTLARHGWVCSRLTDDWGGADFVAQHVDGKIIAVQMKTKPHFKVAYKGRDLWLLFRSDTNWFLGLHDELVDLILPRAEQSFRNAMDQPDGSYSWPQAPGWMLPLITPYMIPGN